MTPFPKGASHGQHCFADQSLRAHTRSDSLRDRSIDRSSLQANPEGFCALITSAAEKMKGVVLRQLQQAPGLVNRALASTTVAGAVDCKPATLFTNGGARGMATGADVMCGRSTAASKQQEKAARAEESSVSKTSASGGGDPKAAPHGKSAKQKWWRPDPATGTWVPEGYEGQVTTSTEAMKAASRVTRIRSDTAASLEDKRWWTSMEELPDMDRANPK